MNFRLRQERNAFVFLVVVATPLVLITAPLPYLSALSAKDNSSFRAERTGLDHAAMVAQTFARADRNGDGKIDRSELARLRLLRERPTEARP